MLIERNTIGLVATVTPDGRPANSHWTPGAKARILFGPAYRSRLKLP